MFTISALVPTEIPVGVRGDGKPEHFLLSACNTHVGNVADEKQTVSQNNFSGSRSEKTQSPRSLSMVYFGSERRTDISPDFAVPEGLKLILFAFQLPTFGHVKF